MFPAAITCVFSAGDFVSTASLARASNAAMALGVLRSSHRASMTVGGIFAVSSAVTSATSRRF